MSRVTSTERIEQLIAAVIVTANTLADSKAREMELDSARPRVKSEAIARLMSTTNPQKPGTTYSATAAAEIVGNDMAFMLHEEDRRQATAGTIRAMGEYEAAKLRAKFGIARAELEIIESEPVRPRVDGDLHTVKV